MYKQKVTRLGRHSGMGDNPDMVVLTGANTSTSWMDYLAGFVYGGDLTGTWVARQKQIAMIEPLPAAASSRAELAPGGFTDEDMFAKTQLQTMQQRAAFAAGAAQYTGSQDNSGNGPLPKPPGGMNWQTIALIALGAVVVVGVVERR